MIKEVFWLLLSEFDLFLGWADQIISSGPEDAYMKIIEGKVHEWAFFMGHIGSKILPNNDVPTRSKLLIKVFFYDSCDFTKLLCLEYIRQICDFFDSGIGSTDDWALIFRLQIRKLDKDFLVVLMLLLLIVLLLLIDGIETFLIFVLSLVHGLRNNNET